MLDLKYMKTLSSLALMGCTASAAINLISYFLDSAFLFVLASLLIIPLLITAIGVISTIKQFDFDTITVILFLHALIVFWVSMNLLGDYQVETDGLGYALKSKSAFIREATVEEYKLYKSRTARLMSAYALFFFYAFYVAIKSSLSQSIEVPEATHDKV